jgi:hypothetical protein
MSDSKLKEIEQRIKGLPKETGKLKVYRTIIYNGRELLKHPFECVVREVKTKSDLVFSAGNWYDKKVRVFVEVPKEVVEK